MTPASRARAVRIERLSHIYPTEDGGRTALADINLATPAGHSIAIIGPSGSGKSTLVGLIAGLQRPTHGHIHIGDTDITALSERHLLAVRATLTAMVVQNPDRSLLPFATARRNIEFAQLGPRSHGVTNLPGPEQLLTDLGLAHLQDTRTDRLSGGERQRLAITVGIATHPAVLILDEPTSQLDTANRDRAIEMITRAHHHYGTTTITVTHDPAVAAAHDHTVALRGGRIDAAPG